MKPDHEGSFPISFHLLQNNLKLNKEDSISYLHTNSTFHQTDKYLVGVSFKPIAFIVKNCWDEQG